MQEGFGRAEGVVLVIVEGNAYLPGQLLLGGDELGGGEGIVAEAFQFPLHQVDAEGGILGSAAKVDAEGAGVGIRGEVGLYVVHQSASFAQGHVEAAVHAGASQQIVQQVEGRALVILCIIAPAAYHDVRLVGVLVLHLLAGHVEGRRGAVVIGRRGGDVGKPLLCPALYFAEVNVALYEEYGIVRPVESVGEGMGICACERF